MPVTLASSDATSTARLKAPSLSSLSERSLPSLSWLSPRWLLPSNDSEKAATPASAATRKIGPSDILRRRERLLNQVIIWSGRVLAVLLRLRFVEAGADDVVADFLDE